MSRQLKQVYKTYKTKAAATTAARWEMKRGSHIWKDYDIKAEHGGYVIYFKSK